MSPILSIGIPTYNRPNQIKVLIESILSQKNIGEDEIEINISDNSDDDATKKLISENFLQFKNIHYSKNETNIGSERNIRRVFSLGNAEYTWLIPDDDKLTYDYSISAVIEQIKKYNNELTFIIVNAKCVLIEKNIVLIERFNEVNKNIYFEDGKDILNVITDADLIGAQRLIIKRSILPHPFEQRHTQDGNVGCMSLGLTAAASGKSLLIGATLITYGADDMSEWRKYWPKIFFIDMSNLLLESVKGLGYSEIRVKEIIKDKKRKYQNILNPKYLFFQQYGLKWDKLILLYGRYFVYSNLVLAPIKFMKNSRFYRKFFN